MLSLSARHLKHVGNGVTKSFYVNYGLVENSKGVFLYSNSNLNAQYPFICSTFFNT